MKQSIFRIQKDNSNPYVMVNKQFIKNEKLSWKAKGVLTYLLSLPDNWKIYEDEIAKHSKDGRECLRSTIKELMDHGYIKREIIRDEKGHFKGYSYSVYETNDHVAIPEVGKPDFGKSDTTNNNLTDNKKSNKEDAYINLPVDGINGHRFFKIYGYYFRQKFGREHMRISEKNAFLARDIFSELIDNDVTENGFVEAVIEHFGTLPKSNNGNIMAFLKASYRHFTVDVTKCYRRA